MTLPIKPDMYKYSKRWPKYIILHHTDELNLNTGSVVFDRPTFQTNALVKSFYELENEYLPYHYVIERVQDEFHSIVSAPLLSKIPFLDLEDVYQESIHIGIMGNYNADDVDRRLYNMLTLRVIIPLMKVFRIPEENIVKHSDISLDPNSSCPGEFVSMPVLINFLRNNMRMKSVSRN